MTKLVIVVRYDLAEPSFDAVTTRIDALRTRLADLGPASVWVATGEQGERVSAAVEAEARWTAQRDRYPLDRRDR